MERPGLRCPALFQSLNCRAETDSRGQGDCLKTYRASKYITGVSKEIEADYGEILLFPPAIEDWVGANHPARFLREVVEKLDLARLGFWESPGEEGRPHYGNRLLLKAWLWGYLNRIRSSRQLEKACRENVSLIWLLGRKEPDHNTLWRFWRRNQEGVQQLFREIVGVANRAGLVGMVLHAVDGTKIQAVASREGAEHLGDLKKQRDQLDVWIDEVESQIRENEEKEQGSYRLPKELEDREVLRRRIDEAMEQLKREKRTSRNCHEPEARMMPCEGRKRFAYNAQAVVDEASGMIVAEEVVDEPCDQGLLVGMLEESEKNLGRVAEDTVADKGYRSERQIGEAAAKGYPVLVNLYKTEGEKAGPYHVSRFKYQAEGDCCICPEGRRLQYERTSRAGHGGLLQRIYRCHHGSQCGVAAQCTKDKQGRKVALTRYHGALVEQRRRQTQAENRVKLKMRKQIVERAFAEIKQHLGFRRWNYRGLGGVRAEWAFVCSVYNLKRLVSAWSDGKSAAFG